MINNHNNNKSELLTLQVNVNRSDKRGQTDCLAIKISDTENDNLMCLKGSRDVLETILKDALYAIQKVHDDEGYSTHFNYDEVRLTPFSVGSFNALPTKTTNTFKSFYYEDQEKRTSLSPKREQKTELRHHQQQQKRPNFRHQPIRIRRMHSPEGRRSSTKRLVHYRPSSIHRLPPSGHTSSYHPERREGEQQHQWPSPWFNKPTTYNGIPPLYTNKDRIASQIIMPTLPSPISTAKIDTKSQMPRLKLLPPY